MSSSDFTFISLRNITAYQPTGSWVPQNYVLNMSTNGAAAWTNRITLDTLRASTITGNTITASTINGDIITAADLIGSTIAGSTILGVSIMGDTMEISSITGSTITGNVITASTFVGSSIGVTTLGGTTIIGDTVAVLNSFAVASSFFTTTTDYTYTGSSDISSMLIVIGGDLWKIPVEFVSTIP